METTVSKPARRNCSAKPLVTAANAVANPGALPPAAGSHAFAAHTSAAAGAAERGGPGGGLPPRGAASAAERRRAAGPPLFSARGRRRALAECAAAAVTDHCFPSHRTRAGRRAALVGRETPRLSVASRFLFVSFRFSTRVTARARL